MFRRTLSHLQSNGFFLVNHVQHSIPLSNKHTTAPKKLRHLVNIDCVGFISPAALEKSAIIRGLSYQKMFRLLSSNAGRDYTNVAMLCREGFIPLLINVTDGIECSHRIFVLRMSMQTLDPTILPLLASFSREATLYAQSTSRAISEWAFAIYKLQLSYH